MFKQVHIDILTKPLQNWDGVEVTLQWINNYCNIKSTMSINAKLTFECVYIMNIMVSIEIVVAFVRSFA